MKPRTQSTILFILLDLMALVFIVYSLLLHHKEIRVQEDILHEMRVLNTFVNP